MRQRHQIHLNSSPTATFAFTNTTYIALIQLHYIIKDFVSFLLQMISNNFMYFALKQRGANRLYSEYIGC